MPLEGFLKPSVIATGRKPLPIIPQCGACGLLEKCVSPMMPIYGEGRKRVLIVDHAPTEFEDRTKKRLTSDAAQLLRSVLKRNGVDLERDCWTTNALICYPGSGAEADKKLDARIGYCRPNLTGTLKSLSPTTVIPLGIAALKSVVGPFWKDKPGSIHQWAGWRIPLQPFNAWVCPTWHPSTVLWMSERKKDPVFDLWFRRHLQAAVELEGAPWKTVPDYPKQVERIYDPDHAASVIDQMIARGGRVAIDYETTCLKPDATDAKIVCCSVSWEGRRTIAYPWVGAAVGATKLLWRSDLYKIAANAKFENRWTLAKLGILVRNWLWCTVQNAHICDNRPGITSIKFQSFVRLGFPAYADHIKPYLEHVPGTRTNRIHETDLDDLLLYCGLDSLVEFKVAVLQMKELGL